MKDAAGQRSGDSNPSRGQKNKGPEGKTGSSCSLTRLVTRVSQRIGLKRVNRSDHACCGRAGVLFEVELKDRNV